MFADGRAMEEVTPRDLVLAARAEGRTPELAGVSLIRADLSGLDLSHCELSGLDLSEADLSGVRLSGARLFRAVLTRANLDEAELLKCDLSEADLSACHGHRAVFGLADLTGARLFGADLTGTSFAAAILREADLRGANLTGARLREADLSGATFDKATMERADLGKSVVEGASFMNADLRHARLRALHGYKHADWVGTDIRGIDFTGAYLLRRFIRDQNYLFEFRNQGRFQAVMYWLWWATSDCGRSAARWFALCATVALAFAALYLVVDVDFGPHRTAFSPLYFSFVTLTTLGYGDVLPVSGAAQVLATVEVILGYLGLGGMLSILASKMARRAD